MRCMSINQQKFYYALFQAYDDIEDEWGNVTGEKVITYGEPIEFRANISPAIGESDTRQFGEDLDYSKIIVTDDLSLPVDEFSILWIDNLNTSESHDYVVKSVAKSINSISIAIDKVNVDEN